MKNYIITLTHEGVEKRVWLSGEDSEIAAQRFQSACDALGTIAEQSKDWPEFFENAIAHFRREGFERIKK